MRTIEELGEDPGECRRMGELFGGGVSDNINWDECGGSWQDCGRAMGGIYIGELWESLQKIVGEPWEDMEELCEDPIRTV